MGGGKGSSSNEPAPAPAPPPQPAFVMPEVAMPEPVYTGPSYEEQQAARQAELERQRAEEERQRNIENRDKLYSDRLTAADTATQFINDQIKQEQANADLLGIDYAITDEDKQRRIEDYFATIWGEGDESKLLGLFDTVGKPQGFEDFTIQRGDPSRFEDGTKANEEVVATSNRRSGKPARTGSTLATSEDEDNLKNKDKLGG